MFTGLFQQVTGISPSYHYHFHLRKNDYQVSVSRFYIVKFAERTSLLLQLESYPNVSWKHFFGCLCLVKDGSSLGDHLKSKILIKDVSVGGSDHLLDYHVIRKPYPDSGIKQSSDLTLT